MNQSRLTISASSSKGTNRNYKNREQSCWMHIYIYIYQTEECFSRLSFPICIDDCDLFLMHNSKECGKKRNCFGGNQFYQDKQTTSRLRHTFTWVILPKLKRLDVPDGHEYQMWEKIKEKRNARSIIHRCFGNRKMTTYIITYNDNSTAGIKFISRQYKAAGAFVFKSTSFAGDVRLLWGRERIIWTNRLGSNLTDAW